MCALMPGPHARPPRKPAVRDTRPVWILVLGVLSVACPLIAPLVWYVGARYTDACLVTGSEPPVAATLGRRIAGAVTTAVLVTSGVWLLWYTLFDPLTERAV
jgi:hypothetical protein